MLCAQSGIYGTELHLWYLEYDVGSVAEEAGKARSRRPQCAYAPGSVNSKDCFVKMAQEWKSPNTTIFV